MWGYIAIFTLYEPCNRKTDLKVFVVVITKRRIGVKPTIKYIVACQTHPVLVKKVLFLLTVVEP